MGAFGDESQRAVEPQARSALLASGVPRRELSGPTWRSPVLGWHVPASVPRTAAQRILEASVLAPDAVVSGWAAAYVHGADVFDGGRGPGAEEDVRIVLPPSRSQVRIRGVRCVRSPLRDDEIVFRRGIRVTSPLRTAVDLAREAPSLVEAVVALDGLLRSRVLRFGDLGLVSARSVRGSAQVRQAAVLARPGVRSPWETRLRLFVVLDLRLPEPIVNAPVFDSAGTFLGAPDLLDVEAGLVLEFDGAGHRERERHRSDNVREEGFERHGLVVVRADSLDLRDHRPELARRIKAGRTDALRRVAPRRWTLEPPMWWRGLPA